MRRSLLLIFAVSVAVGCNDGRSIGFSLDADPLGDTDSDAIQIDVGGDVPDTFDVPDDGDEVITIPDIGSDLPEDTSEDIEPDIPPGCGDGVVDGDEECDDGEENSDTTPDACRPDCTLPICGDSVTDSGEECDDGDDNSDSEADACRTDCTEPFCGDGIVDSGEDCDGGPDCDDECTSPLATLCDPCEFDDDCGGSADFCVDGGCALGCEDAECPDGFSCEDVLGGIQCVPESGTCEPCFDPDGDGYGIGPDCIALDCDQDDPLVNPGAVEICDGFDNNCNGDTDEVGAEGGSRWYGDADGDSFGDPDFFVDACEPTDEFPFEEGDDCDATNPEVYPGAPDFCDGIDNDCDEETGDGIDEDEVGSACDGPDDDRCAGGTTECVEGELICTEGPEGTPELCDGIDNDCDPSTPDGSQDDRVGEACDGDDADACLEGENVCRGGELVCNDVTDDILEICNDEDDDCDGETDEDAGDLWYRDADSDRYGTEDETRNACARPPGFAGRSGDCDDGDSAINPEEDDVCDGLNNDCVGDADDDPAFHDAFSWRDGDGDGFGDPAFGGSSCDVPPGFVDNDGDCNDASAEAAPGLEEICGDGLDNDCAGGADCLDAVCIEAPECVGDCVDASLGSTVGPEAATGTTEGESDRFGSCAGGGPEVVYQWTAPDTGTYILDTLGSDFDTVLYVLESCDGEEIVCNDDAFSGDIRTRSQVTFDAAAGETFLIVIDGFGPRSAGDYVINITLDLDEVCDNDSDDDLDGLTDCTDPDCAADDACAGVDCPGESLGRGLGEVADGDTAGESYGFTSSCGGNGPDVTYQWTAPSSGGFRFDADADFDVDIAVRESCDGAELGCGTAGFTTLDLIEGDSVTIVVDGEDADEFGEYVLSIIELESGRCDDGADNDDDDAEDCFDIDCATDDACLFDGCAEDDLGSELGTIATGALTDFPYAYTASCGDAAGGEPAGGRNAPDAFFTWSAPFSGTFTFDTLGSDYDTLLTILDGDCGGDEIACNDDAFSGDIRTRSSITLDLAEGASITIVVGGWGSSTGDFVLNATAVELVCADGIDNDLDGDTDCADEDCVGSEACLEICDDDVDNDLDGDTDCLDSDCDAVCVEICDDGIDNDDDLDVDCADDECASFPACCPDDVFEPNQGTSGAPSTLWDEYLASSTETLTIRPGDVDSFRVPLCRGGEFTARAEFTHADGDLSLVLRSGFGFTLASVNSGDDNEELTFTPFFGGDYFLQVNIEDDQCQSYTLTMDTGCD